MLEAVKQSLLKLEILDIRKVSENILYKYNFNQKFIWDDYFEWEGGGGWGISLVHQVVINISYNNEQKIVSGSKHEDAVLSFNGRQREKSNVFFS